MTARVWLAADRRPRAHRAGRRPGPARRPAPPLGLRDGARRLVPEDSDDYPSCADPVLWTISTDPTSGLGFASELFDRTGLGDRWNTATHGTWHGRRGSRGVRGRQLLLDLAGREPAAAVGRGGARRSSTRTRLRRRAWPTRPRRARRRTPPLQLRRAHRDVCRATGSRSCRRATDLARGAARRAAARSGRFTTVMQWESYAAQAHDGLVYEAQAESFAGTCRCPSGSSPVRARSRRRELARAADRERLDYPRPLEAVGDPWAYRRYYRLSRRPDRGEAGLRATLRRFSERSAPACVCGPSSPGPASGGSTGLGLPPLEPRRGGRHGRERRRLRRTLPRGARARPPALARACRHRRRRRRPCRARGR
jgi:hypothetical protein